MRVFNYIKVIIEKNLNRKFTRELWEKVTLMGGGVKMSGQAKYFPFWRFHHRYRVPFLILLRRSQKKILKMLINEKCCQLNSQYFPLLLLSLSSLLLSPHNHDDFRWWWKFIEVIRFAYFSHCHVADLFILKIYKYFWLFLNIKWKSMPLMNKYI